MLCMRVLSIFTPVKGTVNDMQYCVTNPSLLCVVLCSRPGFIHPVLFASA